MLIARQPSLFAIAAAALVLAAACGCLSAQGGSAMVTLAGNAGVEEFKDVMELSDGTLLIAGSAENLDWIQTPKTPIAPLGIPNRITGRTAFLLRVSADFSSILGTWHLPPGQAHDFRWIKGTHRPADPTGDLYLSGSCDATSGDYFIARLNGNFVNAAPTGFSWVRLATASNTHGDNRGLQAWDVGGDGRVIHVNQTGETIRVFCLDANGAPMKLPQLRGSHWAAGAPLDDTNRFAGLGSDLPATSVSGISFPADLRSWTESDRLAVSADGNGQIKQGAWPLDLFTPVRDKDGGTTGTLSYGYTGYRSMGKFRIGGIAIHRTTQDFAIGFNIQTRFWDAPVNREQGDFEPAVVCYSGNGALKWWSRLYHEIIDSNGNGIPESGETRISTPDQYLDGLVFDHSSTPSSLVVAARCHGNNTINLWRGDAVAANAGANGFQNQFTGSEGNIHISWLGKLRDADGVLTCASYLSGYLRNTTLTQAAYPQPIHDAWPSHNSGWPSLTTTRVEPGSVRTDAQGRVYLTGIGPRMVTTANAWQKLPRITASVNQGIAPWSRFVRVMSADLSALEYSSSITGEWTYPSPGAQPVGADNTNLFGVFPTSGGMLAVGSQLDSGNPVPVANVPPWGLRTPGRVSGLIAKLPFSGGGSAPAMLPVIVNPPSAAAAVAGTPAGLGTLASDPDDPEESLIYTWSAISGPSGGTVSFLTNSNNAAKSSSARFSIPGSYTIRVTASDPSGRTASADVAVPVAVPNFASWIAAQPGTSGQLGASDDPDGDGIANLLEYALGGNPGTPDTAILPVWSPTGSAGFTHPTLTVTRNPDATDIVYQVETSADLVQWFSGPPHTEVISDTPATLVVRDTLSVGTGQPQRFMRLRVLLP